MSESVVEELATVKIGDPYRPRREYRLKPGARVIRCFDGGSRRLLYSIELPSNDAARLTMWDLYYGGSTCEHY